MSRQRRVRKTPSKPTGDMFWEDAAGFHAVLPGNPPDAEGLAVMEETLRRQIRASPEWKEFVREHGLAPAEALLQQIKARIGP